MLTFKADCKIEVTGEPKLHIPFDVVFNFTPLVELNHSKGISDTAYIRFSRGITYLSGDTVFPVNMQEGSAYSMRCNFVIDSPGIYGIAGIIWASQAKDAYPIQLRAGNEFAKAFQITAIDITIPKPQDSTKKINEWATYGQVQIKTISLPDSITLRFPGPYLKQQNPVYDASRSEVVPDNLTLPDSTLRGLMNVPGAPVTGRVLPRKSAFDTRNIGELHYIQYQADCGIAGPAIAKPHETFEIVCTFTPRGPLAEKRVVPDTAYLTSEKGSQFLGGDTLWIGYLERDRSYTLRGTYSCDTNMIAYFRTRIIAMQATTAPGFPIGLSDSGCRAEEGCTLPMQIKDTSLTEPPLNLESTDGRPKITRAPEKSPLTIGRDAGGKPLRVNKSTGTPHTERKQPKTGIDVVGDDTIIVSNDFVPPRGNERRAQTFSPPAQSQPVSRSATPWPKLEMQGSIEIQGSTEPGSEFNIIFKYKLLPQGKYYEMIGRQIAQLEQKAASGDSNAIAAVNRFHEARDTAYLMVDTNIEYLSNSYWGGRLEPNKEQTLLVRARTKNKVPFSIVGLVGSICYRSQDYLPEGFSCATWNSFASQAINAVAGQIPETPAYDILYDSAGGRVYIKPAVEIGPRPDNLRK